MKYTNTKSHRAYLSLLREYHISPIKEKKVMPKKKPITKVSITRMADEEYAAKFPEAWEVYTYFAETLGNVDLIFSEVNKRKSKYAAYELVYATNLALPIKTIRECIKWSFSKERMATWLYKVPFNHMGTFPTYYNYWVQNVKKKEESGRLSDFRG